ncbi:hypothetical protein K0M31_002420 [Melipona bicolor]|uniref:Uncharacterized protein n=1 Tax=Melipona bicolor TaxID=60889 RepID=A0AA40KYU7_9HYME|nr:hypothetical protein K0M31_002420 [Melipona bicolor]
MAPKSARQTPGLKMASRRRQNGRKLEKSVRETGTTRRTAADLKQMPTKNEKLLSSLEEFKGEEEVNRQPESAVP